MSLPNFRVRVAFGQQRVGDIIQPTGLWRDRLLQLGYIERLPDDPPAALLRAAKPKRARVA